MLLQNLQSELAELILTNDQHTSLVSLAQHIAIYQNNIIANLVNTLRDTYPLVTKMVGDDFFKIAAKEYITQYPSRSANLHDYGEYFGKFLAEYPPVHDLIYLTEIAEFEWACHIIYFAAEHAALDIRILDHLTSDQYEKLYFIMHPASQLMQCHYPILKIIDLCKGNTTEDIDISEGGINLLIIRRDLDICLVPLTASEFVFLTALQDGKTLSGALQETLAIDADFKLDEKLPGWIQHKTIIDCFVAEPLSYHY